MKFESETDPYVKYFGFNREEMLRIIMDATLELQDDGKDFTISFDLLDLTYNYFLMMNSLSHQRTGLGPSRQALKGNDNNKTRKYPLCGLKVTFKMDDYKLVNHHVKSTCNDLNRCGFFIISSALFRDGSHDSYWLLLEFSNEETINALYKDSPATINKRCIDSLSIDSLF